MNDELTSDRWWLLSSSKSERKDLAPYLARLDVINAFETELSRLADGELRERAEVLKRRARAGEALEALLPECFALARETARRTLGERPYEVQLLAGIALHEGKLVEMQTGEGKTLAAVAPVALHALTGRGVHVSGWPLICGRPGSPAGCSTPGTTPRRRRSWPRPQRPAR